MSKSTGYDYREKTTMLKQDFFSRNDNFLQNKHCKIITRYWEFYPLPGKVVHTKIEKQKQKADQSGSGRGCLHHCLQKVCISARQKQSLTFQTKRGPAAFLTSRSFLRMPKTQ